MDQALGNPGDDPAKKQQLLENQTERDAVNKDVTSLQPIVQGYKQIENRGFQAVEKAAPAGTGTITVWETPAERIDAYRNKVQQYRAMQDETNAAFGWDVVGPKKLAAKGEAAAMASRSWTISTRKPAPSRRRWIRC